MTITLQLTESEADVLTNLIDVAIKTSGLPAAVAAVPIFLKLKESATKAEAAEKLDRRL